MTSAGSILIVCTGNVCRSPYIERRLRHELAGTGIEVTSAGTRALVGHDLDAGTRALLQDRGVDAADFTARELTAALVERADLVLAAAREHRAAVARLHPAALRSHLHAARPRRPSQRPLSRASSGRPGATSRGCVRWPTTRPVAVGWCPPASTGVDVTDPIGGPPSLFAQMAAEVDDALAPIVRALRAAPEAGTS